MRWKYGGLNRWKNKPPSFKKLERISDTAFVDLKELDTTFVFDIRYATPHNFTGEVLYPCARCLLRKAVVLKLLMVQYYLLEKGYRLKIFDCYRPYSIQFRMWEKVPDPRFVARPSKGSNHNRGSAVDCTIVDSLGRNLDMGSGFDDFSEKSRFNYPWLTEEQKKNREFLRRVMGMFGFEGISTEWWHFNDNRARFYSISDFPLCEKKEER